MLARSNLLANSMWVCQFPRAQCCSGCAVKEKKNIFSFFFFLPFPFQSDVRAKRNVVPTEKASQHAVVGSSEEEEEEEASSGSGDDFVDSKRALSPLDLVSPNKGPKKKPKESGAKKALFLPSVDPDHAQSGQPLVAERVVEKKVRRRKK